MRIYILLLVCSFITLPAQAALHKIATEPFGGAYLVTSIPGIDLLSAYRIASNEGTTCLLPSAKCGASRVMSPLNTNATNWPTPAVPSRDIQPAPPAALLFGSALIALLWLGAARHSRTGAREYP